MTTGQGQANLCNILCKPLIAPLRKMRAASAEVGSYGKN